MPSPEETLKDLLRNLEGDCLCADPPQEHVPPEDPEDWETHSDYWETHSDYCPNYVRGYVVDATGKEESDEAILAGVLDCFGTAWDDWTQLDMMAAINVAGRELAEWRLQREQDNHKILALRVEELRRHIR